MGALRRRAARVREVVTDYRRMLEDCTLDERLVLLDARNGRAFLGNMFYIAKELVENERYADFRIWASAGRDSYAQTKRFLREAGLGRVQLALVNSKRYFKLLATAKFLITDVCFSANWTRRAGQVVWNTWHGTPVKCMGRHMHEEVCTLSTPQKHLLAADYLGFPNYYSAEHMLKDYMIDELFEGTLLFSGYPRNSALFDKERGDELRARLGIAGKRAYAYLPTYRALDTRNAPPTSFQEVLENFDALLTDDEVMFAKLHPLCADSVDLATLKHVCPVPANCELYAFLNICDGLITDYSSVLFDFAATRRPVVLYIFDREDYLESRGLYFSFGELPFSQVGTAGEALETLRASVSAVCGCPGGCVDGIDGDADEAAEEGAGAKGNADAAAETQASVADEAFTEMFCPWEGPHAAADLCARVFLGQGSDRIIERDCGGQASALQEMCRFAPDDGRAHVGRERLLVYVDERFFDDGGFRTWILDGLCRVDFEKTAVYLSFEPSPSVKSVASEVLLRLPEEICYFPLVGTYIYTPYELRVSRSAQREHERTLAARGASSGTGYVDRVARVCGSAFDNANRRNFACMRPDAAINFDTRHLDKLVRFSMLSCPRALAVPCADAAGGTEGMGLLNEGTAGRVLMPRALLDWAQGHYSAILRQDGEMWETSSFSALRLHPA